MARFLLSRIGQSIPLLIGVSVIAFGLMHLAPGGPLSVYTASPTLSGEDIERMRTLLGLDQPIPVQYVRWASGILVGEWGYTFFGGRPVLGVILERVPATVTLMGTAMLMSLVIALFVGILGATRRNSIFDYIATTGTLITLSFPTFWFSLMAIFLFAVKLRWLPSGGMYELGSDESYSDLARHLVLPTSMLALHTAASWSRYIRSSFIEAYQQDFVRTARAKGLSRPQILFAHVFPNAVRPLISLLGIELPLVFSGALVTETIFGWPGMGGLFLEALNSREYPVLMGLIMFTAVTVIVCNLLADMVNSAIDPRVRLR